MRDQLFRSVEFASAGVSLRIDGEDDPPTSEMDCEKRLPVCEAACCKLTFPLSPQEVEGGRIKWDLALPYYNRLAKSGYCVHLDEVCLGCARYGERPKVCRSYDCSKDDRIWKDFEGVVLNKEWIDENLDGSRPQLMQLFLQGPD